MIRELLAEMGLLEFLAELAVFVLLTGSLLGLVIVVWGAMA